MLDNKVEQLAEMQNILEKEKATIVYFTSPKCNVCKTLRPKIMELMKEEFPEMGRYYVDVSESQELSANFTVFSAPTILVFLEGKEFARKSRSMSPNGLVEEIRRPYDIMTS
jgi:thioredoxin-like negative regulator of GroEL